MQFSLSKPFTLLDKSLFLGVLSCFLGATTCSALDIVLIEEHWELHVGGSDEGRCAPQVTMVMSPSSNLYCDHFIFSLNHWSYPEFAAGGLEVQRWNGETWVSSHRSSSHSSLNTDGETISWVQRIEVADGQLQFTVTNGQSSTWGQFGGQGLLRVAMPTELTHLNGYQPAVSLTESGIGYAGNRVSSLTLMKIAYTTSDEVEHELIAPFDIDTDIDP